MVRLAKSTDLLHDVIDGMDEGFALFDNEERLINCNDRFRAMYPESDQAGLLVPGGQYETLVRAALGRCEAGGDREFKAQLEEWLAQFRDHVNIFENARQDGTWIRSSNRKTRDGLTVCLREDITDAKRAEATAREHERNYRDILDNLEDIFYQIDQEGRISVASSSVTDRLGYEPRELIGMKMVDLYFRPDDRDAFLREMEERGGRVTGYRIRLRHKSGRRVWVSTNARFTHDNSGNFSGVEGLARDVTKEFTDRVTLEDSQERLNDAQRIARIGSWERDLTSNRLWWSDEVYRLFGLEPMSIQPSNDFIILAMHPADKAAALATMGRTVDRAVPYDLDYRIILPDGEVRWVSQHCETVLDDAGQPAILRGTLHDITSRKQSEEKVRQLNSELETRVTARTKELADSERRFKDFAEIGADWFWEMDAQHRFTWFSMDLPNLRDMLGKPRWEIGDDYPGLTDWTEIRTYFSKHEAFQDIEVAVKGKGDLPIWISTSGRPIFGANGQYLGHRGVTRNVTEKRAVELALSAQRKLFDHLLETTSQGYWYVDLEARTIDLNAAMCEILGRSREEVIGHSIRDFVDEVNDRVLLDQIALRGRGITETYEIELLHSSGKSVACITNPTLIYSPTGERTGSLGFWTNVSEIKEIQASLEQANVAVRKADQAKTEFLSAMSHELRTPLNAILGFGQLLEMDSARPLAGDQIESVQQILKGGTYLLSLIDEVLDLAKIEGGSVDLSIEGVSVVSIVADCIDVLQPTAGKAGVGIENLVDSAADPWVLADQTRLKQVLLNLLSNAIKYNSTNGKVTVSLEKHEGVSGDMPPREMHRIMVTDTGLGIPENLRADVFQPFERLGREEAEIVGTGIGLSISKKLAMLMAGDIDFASEEGRGSVFWVDLPVSASKGEKPCPDIDEATRDHLTNTNVPTSPRTFLYVEDNPANLRLMEQIVRRIPNSKLISAHTAELGEDLARRHRPDIIIMDINLPGMNGFEALERLGEFGETREIPVIALSANAMPATVQKGLDAGFKSYLTKPIDVPEFLDALSKITQSWREPA
jgi:PAS domain S-box-containing protein